MARLRLPRWGAARAIAFAAALVCLAFVSVLFDTVLSIPFTSAVAPPVPAELIQRDAGLNVLVNDPAGAPRPGASVRVFAMIGDKAFFAGEAVTDAEGRAHFSGLPRGEAWVVAYDAGRARASTRALLERGP